jgi:hypothetical protein
LLIILLLALLFFSELILHPSWVLYTQYSDLLTYQVPQLRYLVSAWRETGEQPLWCPYSFAGMPFVHDLQVGAFYPPHLILYYLPASMVGPALSWLVVAHLLIAGWTTFFYARTRGLNRTCATVAALGYMFSGKWLLHLLLAGQYVAVGLAWLPLVLLLLERALRGGGIRFATWAGAALALIVLGSHPQFTFYAGLFIAIWTLPVALAESGGPGPGRWTSRAVAHGLAKWFVAGGWTCSVAVALAAVQLLPTIEASSQTSRAAKGMPAEIVSGLFFNLLGLVGPGPESLPVKGWENRTGLTVLWIASALLAPSIVRGSSRLRYQGAICLGLVVFGLGGAFALQSLPGFRLFRHPARMLLVAALPIALLVGEATEAMFNGLQSEPVLRLRMIRSLVLILLIGVLSTAILGWFAGPPLGSPLLVYWASLVATVPVACWLIWSTAAGRDRWPHWTAPRFELAWGSLLVFDLWAFGWPLVDSRSQAPFYTPPDCIRFLIERTTHYDRILDREVPEHGEDSPLGFALPLIDRLEQVRGYNPIDIHRYKEYIQFISDRDEPLPPGNGILNFPVVNKSLLDFLAVRYLVQPSDLPAMAGEPLEVARDRRWRTVASDRAPEIHLFVPGGRKVLPPFTVYENSAAFPQVFVVPRAERLPERTRVLSVLQRADLHQVVFLEDLDSAASSEVRPGAPGRAVISSYEPNHVVVLVDCESPAYLVMSAPWYPGWSCTVDEKPARLYRANYAFRAVPVPAGRHHVRFDFAPTSYRRGRLVSGASVAMVAVFSLAAVFWRRNHWRREPLPSNSLHAAHAQNEKTESE